MRYIFIYQIVDVTSEGIIHTFMASNRTVAERSFAQFINNPKWNGSIVPDDFVLVELEGCEILDSYSDYEELGASFELVCSGDEVVYIEEDKKDEA